MEGEGLCGSGVGAKCGRWNPTAGQVKVLMDLFSEGLRTPSTEQIQEISSHLSSLGEIENKNVFYWFQNHKARERHRRHHHKKRRKHAGVCDEEEKKTLELFPLTSSNHDYEVVGADQCKTGRHSPLRNTMVGGGFHLFDIVVIEPPLDLTLGF